MKVYDHKRIEKYWQRMWGKEGLYTPDVINSKNPFYNLWMFPYPSAEGLHAGHAFASTGSDIFGRFQRMNGKDVFQPIGYDSFGIHSENYAIKINEKPSRVVERTTKNYERQMRSLGHGYDWTRTVTTSDINYYRWTQWLFLKMYEKGLAYRKKAEVNFCPSCKTVLADEQVMTPAQAGKEARDARGQVIGDSEQKEELKVCERCGTVVEKKDLDQWFFKITDYANRLLEGLEKINWSKRVKTAQKEWIGKSEGMLIKFGDYEVFTTRPDTLNAVTFLATSKLYKEGEIIKDKIGKFSGRYAVNPLSKKKIPIWDTNYVAPEYGTGIIMGVPAHDKRDMEFAKKYRIDIVKKEPDEKLWKKIEEKKWGKKHTNYHLRDWLVSRQRYWGAPIPMIYCKKCAKESEKIDTNFLYNMVFNDAEKLAHDFYNQVLVGSKIKIKALKNLEVAFTHDGWDHLAQQGRRKPDLLFRYFGLPKTIFVLALAGEVIGGKPRIIYKDGKKITYWALQGIVDGTWVKIVIRQTPTEKPHFYSVVWKGEEDASYVQKAIKKGAVSRLYPRLQTRDFSLAFSAVEKYKAFLDSLSSEKNKQQGQTSHGRGGWYPVPEEDLPVKLPEIEDYKPEGTGKGPLANHSEFYKVKCPKCGHKATRETDVMDTFVDSSWYFLRYLSVGLDDRSKLLRGPGSPNLSARSSAAAVGDQSQPSTINHQPLPWNSEISKAWLPVDLYFGGAEHSVLHLMYARFVNMVMHDLGYLDHEEPFPHFFAHGLMIKDGAKMSKSRGNVVNPDEYVEKYGADTLRLYLMFMGPMDGYPDFRDSGIEGMQKFIKKVWKLFTTVSSDGGRMDSSEVNVVTLKLHQTIKKVTKDIQVFKYNTAIASLMECVNEFTKYSVLSTKYLAVLAQLLAPFVPHMSEEVWQKVLGYKSSVHESAWPTWDEKYLEEKEATIVVQINGKLRSQFIVGSSQAKDKEYVISEAQKLEKVASYLKDQKIKTTIFVPGKLVNFVV